MADEIERAVAVRAAQAEAEGERRRRRRDIVLRALRKWKKANPAKVAAQKSRRRARLRDRGASA